MDSRASQRDIENRLDKAQEIAKIGVWEWDFERNLIISSTYLYTMFGLEASTAPTAVEKWTSLMHPDDLQQTIDSIMDAYHNKQKIDCDFRIVLPNGNLRWINLVGDCTPDDQSSSRMIGVCTDVTERKKTEEILKKSAERDKHIADVLQQTVMPPNIAKERNGFQLAARYRPALLEAEVCGDFCDIFDLGNNRVGVVIGDVVGKGLLGAVRVAAARNAIRCYAYLDNSPSCVMSLVNEALSKDISIENDMLTAFFAVLDTTRGILTYCNAGHEPPLHRKADGNVSALTVGGPMFIGMGTQVYREDSVRLGVDDIVVMFTDGITEARNTASRLEFGPSGVTQCLAEVHDIRPEEIAEKVLDAASDYVDGVLRDDAAIIVIKQAKEVGERTIDNTTVENHSDSPNPFNAITGAQLIEEALIRSESDLQSLLHAISESACLTDRNGIILTANETFAARIGRRVNECIGRTIFEVVPEPVASSRKQHFERVLQTGKPVQFEDQRGFIWFRNSIVPVKDADGNVIRLAIYAADITRSKHAEAERQAVIDIFSLINSNQELHEAVRVSIEYLASFLDCEAVGIRLQEGEDYPYFETRGLPDDFIMLEKSLCCLDSEGCVLRDESGCLCLECMCGNVIRGRFDPSLPFFTAGGSFWTNSTTRLLAQTSEADRQARTRNRCNGEGYESVALIPLSCGGENIGLLQLNDRREGRFDIEKIELLERICENLASTIKEKQSKRALEENEKRLRFYLDNSPMAVAEWDENLVVTKWTGSAQSIFGWSAEEIVGRYMCDLKIIVEDDLPLVSEALDKVVSGENTVAVCSNRNYTKDGRIIFCEWYNTIILDENKKMRSVLSQALDMTQRQLTQDALAHKHELMKYIIDHSSAGIAVHDKDLRYLFVSQHYLDAYHIADADIIGKHHYEVFPKLPGKWKRVHQRALNGEVITAQDDPYIDENGKTEWTTWECRPWYDVDGTIGGIIVYTEVVTERKLAEQEKRQFYRDTIKSVTQGKLELVTEEEVEHYLSEASLVCDVNSAKQSSEAHKLIYELCIEAGMDEERCRMFEHAVGEAAVNAINHASGCRLYAKREDDVVWVAVSDKGPGISTMLLPSATLRSGFSSKASMGMGYTIMMEGTDNILLCTGPAGTTVVLSVNIKAESAITTLSDLPVDWDNY